MPRDIVTTLYTFEELPTEKAKETARDWWRYKREFAWSDESLESIKAFCAQFNVKLERWSIGAYYPIDYHLSEYGNDNFRGLRLSQFERESYPTGYCLDADLSITFFDTFKKTGDAKYAFESAIDAGFKAWRDDLEWQLSDEHVDDMLIANEYEFTETGKRA